MTRKEYYLAQQTMCLDSAHHEPDDLATTEYECAAESWGRLADHEQRLSVAGPGVAQGLGRRGRRTPAPVGARRAEEPKSFAAAQHRDTHPDVTASILVSSPDCIKILDLDGTLVFMSEGGKRTMEVTDFELIRGRCWPEFWEGQGRCDAEAAMVTAREGGTAQFQGHANTMAGTSKWWDVTVSPILDAEDRVERLLSVSRDITAGEDARQLGLTALALERMNNMLGVVHALALQSLKGTDTLAQAREKLSCRIVAISNAYRMVIATKAATADLRSLAEASIRMQPHANACRISLDGPAILLGSEAALCFALVIHEMVTNALAHGALSGPDGHVTVSWCRQGHEDDPHLAFGWREGGGPAFIAPTTKGFGTRYIERSLSLSLGANFELSYPAEGAALTMDFAIGRLNPSIAIAAQVA